MLEQSPPGWWRKSKHVAPRDEGPPGREICDNQMVPGKGMGMKMDQYKLQQSHLPSLYNIQSRLRLDQLI